MKSKSTQKNRVNEAQDPAVVRKQIETRAYEIWAASGGAHGDDVKHWLQAENEVLSVTPPMRNQGQQLLPPPALPRA